MQHCNMSLLLIVCYLLLHTLNNHIFMFPCFLTRPWLFVLLSVFTLLSLLINLPKVKFKILIFVCLLGLRRTSYNFSVIYQTVTLKVKCMKTNCFGCFSFVNLFLFFFSPDFPLHLFSVKLCVLQHYVHTTPHIITTV